MGVSGCGKSTVGKLLGEKLIVGHVLAERADHPVAPRPHGAGVIELVAIAIGVACVIQPDGGHAFGVVDAGE